MRPAIGSQGVPRHRKTLAPKPEKPTKGEHCENDAPTRQVDHKIFNVAEFFTRQIPHPFAKERTRSEEPGYGRAFRL